MRALFRYAEPSHGRRYPGCNQKLCVVARGGYGRAELNPYSDIDLSSSTNTSAGPYAEVVTEVILHALWDARLTVGHSVRNARECVRMAAEDLKEKTAILDARFLAGDEQSGCRTRKAMLRREVLESRADRNSSRPSSKETRGRHRQVRRIDLSAGAANQGRRRRPARFAYRAVAGESQVQDSHSVEELVQQRDYHRRRN